MRTRAIDRFVSDTHSEILKPQFSEAVEAWCQQRLATTWNYPTDYIEDIFMGPTNLRKPAFLKPAFLGSEFNAFLFAPIGADASGTNLTVLSALARLDLDPWTEAATLARLPGSIATQKFAEMVSRFPEIPSVSHELAQIAARLTGLLPGRTSSKLPAPEFSIRGLHPAAQTLMAPRFLLLLIFLTLGVMLVTQAVVAQHPPVAQISGTAQTVTPHSFQARPLLGDGLNVQK